MSETLSIEPRKTALLLMDFQNFVLDNFLPSDASSEVVTRAAALLAAAREARMMVIHVTVGFRPGYPEVSTRNKLFSFLKGSGFVAPGSGNVAVRTELAPRDNEPVVVKHRIGAFTSTDLDRILRAQDIETLILSGVTTGGVVLSTLRQAFDLDYGLIVAADACVDNDIDVHATLMEKVLPQHATVVDVAEVGSALIR